SSVVATAVAEPAFTPVTLPLPSMVNVSGLPDFQATFLLVALPGATVALSCAVAPSSTDNSVLSNLTPVTATAGSLTVTLVCADLLPSLVPTLMLAVPGATAVTTPLLSTVATFSLSLAQFKPLLVASVGATVAFSVAVLPVSSDNVVLSSDTPVTGCVAVLNDNGVLADFPA